MAKEDFCFTYYDGDAARDKAHMSRLERGAYDDLISAQRKRGHLSLDDIKKVLGKDFSECWGSLEWVLKSDAEGKFFIEWVDKSLEKMRAHSQKQKERVGKRWQKDTENIPRYNHGNNSVEPVKDIENGNEDELKEEGTGETNFPGEAELQIEFPETKMPAAIEMLRRVGGNPGATAEDITALWEIFKVDRFTGKNWYANIEATHSHFIQSLKFKKIGSKSTEDWDTRAREYVASGGG